MKSQKLIAGAAAGAVLIASTAGAVRASADSGESVADGSPRASGHPLTGVWTVTVDPLPNPGGDQPPFESTLAFGRASVVNEITSRVGSASAGLGTWEKVGDSTYRTRWLKYRFDGTGAYIGKTVVTEDITVVGSQRYRGRAVTQIVDSAGAVVAQFESEVAAERLQP